MGVASGSTCARCAALSYRDRRVGPWRTFACDLPVGSIRPETEVHSSLVSTGVDEQASLRGRLDPLRRCVAPVMDML